MHSPLRLFAAALVLLWGCSSPAPTTPSPSAPLAPVLADGLFNGVWQVGGTVTACDGIRNCIHMRGDPTNLDLRLLQVGTLVAGSAVVTYGSSIVGVKIFDVKGAVHDGELRLTGHQPAAGGCAGEATLDELVLRSTGSSWSGHYRWTSTRPASCTFTEYHSLQEARLESASRVANRPTVDSFSGSWAGSAVTDTCAPADVIRICQSGFSCVTCQNGTRHPFSAELTQTGDRVTGTLWHRPVTGIVVQSGMMTLSSERTLITTSDPQGTSVYTIPPATFVLDHVGRLTGTYRVEREFIPKDGGPTTFWSQNERLDQVVIR